MRANGPYGNARTPGRPTPASGRSAQGPTASRFSSPHRSRSVNPEAFPSVVSPKAALCPLCPLCPLYDKPRKFPRAAHIFRKISLHSDSLFSIFEFRISVAAEGRAMLFCPILPSWLWPKATLGPLCPSVKSSPEHLPPRKTSLPPNFIILSVASADAPGNTHVHREPRENPDRDG